MWIFSFYRMYGAIAVGVGTALLAVHTWWFALLITIIVRGVVAAAEFYLHRLQVERLFKAHAYAFKQELGPYGIRMVNRAEKEFRLRKSLAEVFVKSEKKLRKAVEQLDMMETLYKAGMQPDADTWQLHDLKLKYGRFRIEQLEKSEKQQGEK